MNDQDSWFRRGLVEEVSDVERLFVDFDNTLTQSDVEYWNGERPDPDPDVIRAVREHYHSGGTVVVWTARPWSEANQVAAHLTEWQVPFHGLQCVIETFTADLLRCNPR